MTARIVHILEEGRARCGIPGLPKDWPEGHVWVAANEGEAPAEATCPWCVEPFKHLSVSPVAREVMLGGMELAARAFYASAVPLHCHPFIEFTGLLNEYVGICRRAHAAGFAFEQASAHGGEALPMAPYEAAYIGEKLGCIFGPSLRDPENLKAFLRAAGLADE